VRPRSAIFTTMTDDAGLRALTQLFAELGAPAPERWARTQVEHGVPELARYLFLRAAWRHVLADGDTGWIEGTVQAARAQPDAPFAGVGAALARLRDAGAHDADISEVVRGMQVAALFALLRLLDGAPGAEPEVADIGWALVQVSPDGAVGAPIRELHASLLDTDPTGREMRPATT
jgi:hypothetical protein